jgi:hypothetical protein
MGIYEIARLVMRVAKAILIFNHDHTWLLVWKL